MNVSPCWLAVAAATPEPHAEKASLLVASNHSTQGPGSAANGDVDLYALLGVPYTATTADIRRAYRESMKHVHPDTQRAELRGVAEEQAKMLNHAYAVLSHPTSRLDYDRKLRSSAVQEQIMRKYVGGFVTPDMVANDQHGERFRREPTEADRREQARAERSATISVLFVFAFIAVAVVIFLLVWAVIGQVVSSLI